MKMKKLSLVYKTFVPVIIQKKIKDYCDLDHGGDAGGVQVEEVGERENREDVSSNLQGSDMGKGFCED